MIAVTFALASESSALLGQLSGRTKISADDGSMVRGTIAGHDLVILHTGVGSKIARARVAAFLAAQQPRLLISAGFAGAARDDLRTGDLVVAENFSDPQLFGDAMRILRGRNPRRVKLFTASTIVDGAEERSAIANREGADAIDMETATVAEVCRSRGLPVLSIRVISDTPSQPFPAPSPVLFDVDRQRTNFAKLFFYLLGHPTAVGRLVRFTRRIGDARLRLTGAIVELVQAV